MVVFVVALLSTVVMGMLEINTEDIQVMLNHVFLSEALATAEAGLEDAFMNLRLNKVWVLGFTAKTFNSGFYTVTVAGQTVTSVGTTSRGYTASIAADFSATGSSSPYTIKVNALRINE